MASPTSSSVDTLTPVAVAKVLAALADTFNAFPALNATFAAPPPINNGATSCTPSTKINSLKNVIGEAAMPPSKFSFAYPAFSKKVNSLSNPVSSSITVVGIFFSNDFLTFFKLSLYSCVL